MLLHVINGLFMLFFTVQLNSNQDLKTMVGKIMPLRSDGKIEIPAHIRHIKLDIGLSYSAPMSRDWLSREDDLLVFGFEPNPVAADSVLHKEMPKKFIGERFFLIPCALGLSNDVMIKFFVTENDCGCSSIYEPSFFPIERIIDVPIFSLAAFFDLFPFDSHPVIDYIKIDAQGADLDIVKSAGNYLSERVIFITLEAENEQYENTVNSFLDIKQYMQSIGFMLYVSPYTKDPTYFNSRYFDYIKSHDIQIYQH